MKFSPVALDDLNAIRALQPEGWPDIVVDFEKYIHFEFCYPQKLLLGDRTIAVGCAIVFEDSAWLAHIIVSEAFRKKGYGHKMVSHLLDMIRVRGIGRVSLVATSMGAPVYARNGFLEITNYTLWTGESTLNSECGHSPNICSFTDAFRSQVLDLDRHISGENRAPLITHYLADSYLYLDNKKVTGVFLPSLGQGFIGASTAEAGMELLKLKLSASNYVVLPSENHAAVQFLAHNGFEQQDKVFKRMSLGESVPWKAGGIFARIGGNYG
ncbi:MAG: GNAT family N-acetyltransferase [Deltaproteobacteria bacterium]|nr:GNAT family N-acetyltransferase [Deltaproteobacteria bacterium]